MSIRKQHRRRRWLVLALAAAAIAAPTAQGRPAPDEPGVPKLVIYQAPQSKPVAPQAPAPAQVTGGSFDWGDAAIGAGIGLTLGLLGGGAASVVRYRGRLAGV